MNLALSDKTKRELKITAAVFSLILLLLGAVALFGDFRTVHCYCKQGEVNCQLLDDLIDSGFTVQQLREQGCYSEKR